MFSMITKILMSNMEILFQLLIKDFIFFNLKESNKSKEDFSLLNYDENSMSLYSAMIRVGEMPLNNEFLKYDPVNFSMPIVLSGCLLYTSPSPRD